MGRRLTLLLGLAACGPKIDPLDPLKTELARAPVPEPQATVVLDDGAISAMVADLLGHPQTAPGPLGIRVVVVPTLGSTTVRATPADADGAVILDAAIDGELDIAFPLASQDDLRFAGQLRAPVLATVRPDPAGSWVLVSWVDRASVQVGVQLPDANAALESLTTGLVQGALSGVLAEPKGALVPTTPWGPVADVQLGAVDDDLLAYVTVAGAPGVRAEPVAAPEGGFAVILSEGSTLGLLQGLAARSQEEETYVVEPRGIRFVDGHASAELVVHKRARQPKWRRYRVSGPVSWEGGRLRVSDVELELLEAHRWSGGLSVSIGEGRAVSTLQDGVGGLPTALVQPLTADLALRVEVSAVETRDGQLVVSGPLRVVPRRSDDADAGAP